MQSYSLWAAHWSILKTIIVIELEDSNNDLRSALAAGIKTYITLNPYTCKQDFAGAAAVFDDLSDLPRFYQTANLPLPK